MSVIDLSAIYHKSASTICTMLKEKDQLAVDPCEEDNKNQMRYRQRADLLREDAAALFKLIILVASNGLIGFSLFCVGKLRSSNGKIE